MVFYQGFLIKLFFIVNIVFGSSSRSPSHQSKEKEKVSTVQSQTVETSPESWRFEDWLIDKINTLKSFNVQVKRL